jgi:hypothetical protein
VGVALFDWSGSQLVFFLLVGVWIAILCDFAKLYLLPEAVHRYAQSRYDDWHVWVVVEAIRFGKNKALRSYLRATYQPKGGVIIDVIMGGLSTFVIWGSFTSADPAFVSKLFVDQWVVFSLIGIAVCRIGFTGWEIVEHRIVEGADRGVKIAVGLRGVGLFLFMFLILLSAPAGDKFADNPSDGEAFAQIMMLVLNGLIVIFGLFTVVGPWTIRGDTEWLRAYLKHEQPK